MLKLRQDFHVPFSQEAQKSLREGAFYLNESVRAAIVDDSKITILFDDVSAREEINSALSELIAKTHKSFRRVREKTLFRQSGAGTFSANPMTLLLDKGLLFHNGPGRYSYSGWLVELLHGLDTHFRAFALAQGAVEELYPPTVMTKSLEQAGYVESFPHHALFVSAAKRSTKVIESIANARESNLSIEATLLEVPEVMMAPTVCYRCFEAHQHACFSSSGTLFTALGHCNRNEGFIDDDLTRMQSFLMREIIYIGDENYVKKQRQETVLHAQEFVAEHGLSVRLCSASDPFFVSTAGEKSTYQNAAQTKLEMQIHLPFSDRWISCMSFNNHEKTWQENLTLRLIMTQLPFLMHWLRI